MVRKFSFTVLHVRFILRTGEVKMIFENRCNHNRIASNSLFVGKILKSIVYETDFITF